MAPTDDDELDRALAAARPTPRPGFADQVLARLEAPRATTTTEPPASPRSWTWLAVGGALAAAAVLLVATLSPPSPRPPSWRAAGGRVVPDGEPVQAPDRGLTLIGADAVVDVNPGSILRPHGPALALERGGLRLRGAATISTPFGRVVSSPDDEPADLTVTLQPEEPPMTPLKLAAITAFTGTAITVAVVSGRAFIHPTADPTAAPPAPIAVAAGQTVDLDQGGLVPKPPTKPIRHGVVGPLAPLPDTPPATATRVVKDPPCDDCLDVSENVPVKVDVPIGGSPALGPVDACVNIVVFTDYECPFCEKSLSTLHDLAALYPKDVRIAVKNLPLAMHPHAKLAAEAALAAQAQDRFWAMHDAILANQEAMSRTDLIAHAGRLGLDVARFTADLDGHVYADEVQAESDLAVAAGVKGVPAFIMNGKLVQGARPLDVMKGLVDAELESCRAPR